MTFNISVPYTEQHLTADEVARRFGLWRKYGKEAYPKDDRDPTIWLSEMYDEGYNMDVMEGIIIMGDEENKNHT